jgi:carnitine O-acetyltransferase
LRLTLVITLQAICDLSDSSPASPEEHLGLLTHLSRDRWAELRTAIVASQPNAASLEAIDTALFALCLDVDAPKGA